MDCCLKMWVIIYEKKNVDDAILKKKTIDYVMLTTNNLKIIINTIK